MEAETVAAIVSFGVLVLSIIQAVRQEKLMARTSSLEAEVNRLSVELDQSLQRLHQVNELARQIHRLSATLMYGHKQHSLPSDVVVDLVGCLIELEALAQVIGDEELTAYVVLSNDTLTLLREAGELEMQNGEAVVNIPNQKALVDALDAFSSKIGDLHRRVYEMLESTSHTPVRTPTRVQSTRSGASRTRWPF